jgi:cellulose synthase/poly-beta-1,6-N-acetylglucosamine synthase-like glycosyltransferase
MTISIIIAVKAWQKHLEECVNKCLKLSSSSLKEIIILPDSALINPVHSDIIKIVPTGSVFPAYKRDIGVRAASGDIIAMIDDDAYPANTWLTAIIREFEQNPSLAAVCGPAITPDSDNISQKSSGLVYSSFMVSCGQNYRYIPKAKRYVVDYPSCNFIVRKDVFESVGGFDTPYWPGEDTFLCYKIVEKGLKMLYHPDILVYHHRRPLFRMHLNQIKSYALHRGYFAKKYPQTSLRWDYFIPSVFVIAILLWPLVSFSGWFKSYYYPVMFSYLLAVLVNSIMIAVNQKSSTINTIKYFLFVIAGIIMTHITYGVYCLSGLFAHRMPEERT